MQSMNSKNTKSNKAHFIALINLQNSFSNEKYWIGPFEVVKKEITTFLQSSVLIILKLTVLD